MLIVPECRIDARPETETENLVHQHGTVAGRVALFEQQTATAGPAQREQPQFAVARNRRQRPPSLIVVGTRRPYASTVMS